MNRSEFFGRLSHLSEPDLLVVRNAYWLAKEAHRRQTRDGGVRYFEHPRDAAVVLISRGHTTARIIAKALLHDTPEDTYTPPNVIEALCGAEVMRSSLTLSKIERTFDPLTGFVLRERKKNDSEYWAAIAAAELDERLVKCADRYLNLGDMASWVPERRLKYAEETEERVIPIARATDAWFYDELRRMVDGVRAAVPA